MNVLLLEVPWVPIAARRPMYVSFGSLFSDTGPVQIVTMESGLMKTFFPKCR